MQTAIIIPARYASTRYPGKPLAELRGANGVANPLIQRSWEAAMAVQGASSGAVQVFVATDDDRIVEAARAFGAEVLMTAPECENGTVRCHDALRSLPEMPDLVVNLQGDAPLTPPWFVEALITAMQVDETAAVATPVLRCDGETYGKFIEDRRAGRVGGTTAVFGSEGRALYFSKEVVPFLGEPLASSFPPEAETPVFHHVGVYAYRPAALDAYVTWAMGPLERLEGLEQLRFLENGASVKCVEVDARGRVFWELNNPVDVERIEAVLRTLGME